MIEKPLTIARSKWSLFGAMAVAAGAAAAYAFDASQPGWQRLLSAIAGSAVLFWLASRWSEYREAVLTLDSRGVSDRRLEPELIPWAQVADIRWEPTYFRGGAVLVSTTGPLPTVRRAWLLPALNEQSPKVSGSEIRLPLRGYSYDALGLKQAIESAGASLRAA